MRINKDKCEMSKKRINIIPIFLILLILSIGIVYFLDMRYDYSRHENENAVRFGVSFMTMNNPFFSVISDSIRTAAEANGDIVMVRDPALDADRQDKQIRDLIKENIDVLFVTPVDFDAVIPAILEAKKKGIVVILVDTEIYDDSIADGVVVSNNYLAGVQCGEYLMRKKDSASILILEHNRTKSGNDRVKGFIDALAGNTNYKVVGIENAEGQLEIAMPVTKQAINNGLEFDTVFAINDLSALGAMAALKDSDRLQNVDVLGVDGAPEAKAMIKENLMLATSAQHPTKIGDYAINQAYKILNKEEYTQKILVDVELVSIDNVDEFGIDNWQ